MINIKEIIKLQMEKKDKEGTEIGKINKLTNDTNVARKRKEPQVTKEKNLKSDL